MSAAIPEAGVAQTLLDKVWIEIKDQGLESYISDLDVNGYAILSQELASPNNLCDRLLDAR